jgi:hypothetical protein
MVQGSGGSGGFREFRVGGRWGQYSAISERTDGRTETRKAGIDSWDRQLSNGVAPGLVREAVRAGGGERWERWARKQGKQVSRASWRANGCERPLGVYEGSIGIGGRERCAMAVEVVRGRPGERGRTGGRSGGVNGLGSLCTDIKLFSTGIILQPSHFPPQDRANPTQPTPNPTLNPL